MNTVKLVAVFVENKPGQTARITRILADASVNIRWVTIATSEKFGVMKFLVDKPEAALEALRQHGLTASHLDALAAEIKDKPGALYAVTDLLARQGVNVENVSGFVANSRAVIVLEVEDVPEAQMVLDKHHIRLLTEKEMLSL
jgi:hypothetical protein